MKSLLLNGHLQQIKSRNSETTITYILHYRYILKYWIYFTYFSQVSIVWASMSTECATNPLFFRQVSYSSQCIWLFYRVFNNYVLWDDTKVSTVDWSSTMRTRTKWLKSAICGEILSVVYCRIVIIILIRDDLSFMFTWLHGYILFGKSFSRF